MEKEIRCNSCNIKLTNLVGSAKFKCPNCGKADIIRCKSCREVGAKYKCSQCEFTGPN